MIVIIRNLATTLEEAANLTDFPQGRQHLFVRWSLSVIDFDEFPAHHTLWVNDVSGRMRPNFAVGVENFVAVDHLVVFIFQARGIVITLEICPGAFG